ncbi:MULTISPECIES: hypothetical protein [unclassified Rhizobium]|uniref:hypothetical protein n=1 Tax=unclassified Rhizobium TaxID=2613769 RepID=UPI00115CA1F2|nr:MULTISPECIES: hypothetical protein [unclassified Rhizobium]TQX90259.1 hypothetical protein EQW76_11185 [Rhizobium sp. rho-13.1]TQY16209.1 hypothetical protein EQW74_10775 [Rhizobium sp. rho-1.1]
MDKNELVEVIERDLAALATYEPHISEVVANALADIPDWDYATASAAVENILVGLRSNAETAHGIVSEISTEHIEDITQWQAEQQNAAFAAAAGEGTVSTPTYWDDFKTFDIKTWDENQAFFDALEIQQGNSWPLRQRWMYLENTRVYKVFDNASDVAAWKLANGNAS